MSNNRTPVQRYTDYGLPVGTSDVDRASDEHGATGCQGMARAGEGCRTCIEHLAELWPAAPYQYLDAALIDRQDELDRRRADDIPDDAQPVDDLPLLSCAPCSVVRLGYEVTGWPGVEYRCQFCGQPWTTTRRTGMHGPNCRSDNDVTPEQVSIDPLEEYACLECGIVWTTETRRQDRLPVTLGRFVRRALRRLVGAR